MKTVISAHINRIAKSLYATADEVLDKSDISDLKEKGPLLVSKIKDNPKKDILKGLSNKEKRILLAYIVFYRQNITTTKDDIPNCEDAAKILHKDVFENDNAKNIKKIEKDLISQLAKVGISPKN